MKVIYMELTLVNEALNVSLFIMVSLLVGLH